MPHTPGPWTYSKSENSDHYPVWQVETLGDGKYIGELSRITDGEITQDHSELQDWQRPTTKQDQTDKEDTARLIVAAPDLLKALQFYANDGGELAREAIRKALGDYKVA